MYTHGTVRYFPYPPRLFPEACGNFDFLELEDACAAVDTWAFLLWLFNIVLNCIFPVSNTIGKRKRKIIVSSEAAKKRIRVYCDKVKADKSGDEATQSSTSHLPHVSQGPEQLITAAYRDKLLSEKLSDVGDVNDDNSLVLISIGRLK